MDPLSDLGDTSIVNMVRRACKKVFFEPGDTKQQWKGEAATTSFKQGSPVAARYRPPASATGPRFYLVFIQGLRREVILRGRFVALKPAFSQIDAITCSRKAIFLDNPLCPAVGYRRHSILFKCVTNLIG